VNPIDFPSLYFLSVSITEFLSLNGLMAMRFNESGNGRDEDDIYVLKEKKKKEREE